MGATEGQDFLVVSEVVVFQPNEQYNNLTVLILPDTIPEEVEMFTLSVTPTAANASVLGKPINPETTIHIIDDDRAYVYVSNVFVCLFCVCVCFEGRVRFEGLFSCHTYKPSDKTVLHAQQVLMLTIKHIWQLDYILITML